LKKPVRIEVGLVCDQYWNGCCGKAMEASTVENGSKRQQMVKFIKVSGIVVREQ